MKVNAQWPIFGARLISSPLRSRHHHVDLSAAAAGTDQPLAPIEHGRFGAVPSSHLGRVGLNLVPTFFAPDDQPHTGRGSDAEHHRRARVRFHRGCPSQAYEARLSQVNRTSNRVNP
jgi:hypothetical protein